MPDTVLVLCTANICRSPMAAGLLQHALAAQPEPLRSLKVVSAGVAARTGEPVSEYSAVALRKVGIDISQHRSQPLTQKLVDDALAIVCMTESHRAMVLLHADPAPKNVYLMREFFGAPGEKEIPDPFGGPLKIYEVCRDEMVEAIPSLIDFLKTQVAGKSA